MPNNTLKTPNESYFDFISRISTETDSEEATSELFHVLSNYPKSGESHLRDSSVDTIKQLIENGADVNCAAHFSDRTAVMYAILHGYETTKLLIKSGADIHSFGSDGVNALIFATITNSHKVMELLIRSNAKLEALDKAGWRMTALMYACIDEDVEGKGAKLLIAAGADISTSNRNGGTATNFFYDNLYHETKKQEIEEFYDKTTQIVVKHNANHLSQMFNEKIYNDDLSEVKDTRCRIPGSASDLQVPLLVCERIAEYLGPKQFLTRGNNPMAIRLGVIEKGLKEMEQNDPKSKKRKLPFAEEVSKKRARTADDNERSI